MIRFFHGISGQLGARMADDDVTVRHRLCGRRPGAHGVGGRRGAQQRPALLPRQRQSGHLPQGPSFIPNSLAFLYFTGLLTGSLVWYYFSDFV